MLELRRCTAMAALILSSNLGVGLLAGDALGCTSIMVGRKASADGSVMTSHTCRSDQNFGVDSWI